MLLAVAMPLLQFHMLHLWVEPRGRAPFAGFAQFKVTGNIV